MLIFKKQITRQQVKSKYRKNLSCNFSKESKNYLVDTSAVINKFLQALVKKGITGKLIIPNAVMAELENLANKGVEEGFIGLEEIAKLHHQNQLKIHFHGARPGEMHIKFAKSGEIDALIRDLARKYKAVLITADLVQAKSSQAYGLKVLFLKPKIKKQKKGFWLFR